MGTIAKKLILAVFISGIAAGLILYHRRADNSPQRPVPGFRAIGPETAPIQIYEYTDFACPACRHAARKLEEILKIYDGKVRLNFKHFPLTGIHKWSVDAARNADCAGRQGKFEAYAALLFENQEKWADSKDMPAQFEEYAKSLKLDINSFRACLSSAETAQEVSLNMAEGKLKRVDSTPTFFINGRRAVGAKQLLDAAANFDNILAERGK